MSGMEEASAKRWKRSDTKPMRGVSTAPPIIAMTRKEPPILVWGPRPLSPSAKIVGNISDMKKLVRKRHQKPTQPGWSTATDTNRIFARAYAPIKRLGERKRIR